MTERTARGPKRKSFALVAALAACLALAPGEALAGRRGADVRITLLGGGRVSGELIAVRGGELVVRSAILESTVAIADIDSVIVAGNDAGFGLPQQLGVFAGIALGFVAASSYSRWYHDRHDAIPVWTYPLGIAGGAMLGSAAGGWVSGKGGRDKLYQIKGQSPQAVARIMAKLKRKARLRVAF